MSTETWILLIVGVLLFGWTISYICKTFVAVAYLKTIGEFAKSQNVDKAVVSETLKSVTRWTKELS